jgi:hypothetical protein
MLATVNEAITGVFFVANAGRMLAYLPQLKAALDCNNGAKAISRSTWGYFAFAHLSGILYGEFVIKDNYMALIFCGNFLVCCLLLGIVTWKSRSHARAQRQTALKGETHHAANVIPFGHALAAHPAAELQNAIPHGTMTELGGTRHDGRFNDFARSRTTG